MIGRSCWMFIDGGDAWFFGAPVLILVLVSPKILIKNFFWLSRGQVIRVKKSSTWGLSYCLDVLPETPRGLIQKLSCLVSLPLELGYEVYFLIVFFAAQFLWETRTQFNFTNWYCVHCYFFIAIYRIVWSTAYFLA